MAAFLHHMTLMAGSSPFPWFQFSISNLKSIKPERRFGDQEICLLIMGGRNALEEDFGFGRVNVDVDPPRPCGQPFIICNQTVHILVQLIPLLHVIPSVQMQHSPSDLAMKP